MSREVSPREDSGTAWFVGIIVGLALCTIGFLVLSASSTPPEVSARVTTPYTQAQKDWLIECTKRSAFDSCTARLKEIKDWL